MTFSYLSRGYGISVLLQMSSALDISLLGSCYAGKARIFKHLEAHLHYKQQVHFKCLASWTSRDLKLMAKILKSWLGQNSLHWFNISRLKKYIYSRRAAHLSFSLRGLRAHERDLFNKPTDQKLLWILSNTQV